MPIYFGYLRSRLEDSSCILGVAGGWGLGACYGCFLPQRFVPCDVSCKYFVPQFFFTPGIPLIIFFNLIWFYFTFMKRFNFFTEKILKVNNFLHCKFTDSGWSVNLQMNCIFNNILDLLKTWGSNILAWNILGGGRIAGVRNVRNSETLYKS